MSSVSFCSVKHSFSTVFRLHLADSLGLGSMPGISQGLGAEFENDEHGASDFADDPISTMDFRAAIRSSLQQFVQLAGEQAVAQLGQSLSAEEARTLQHALSER